MSLVPLMINRRVFLYQWRVSNKFNFSKIFTSYPCDIVLCWSRSGSFKGRNGSIRDTIIILLNLGWDCHLATLGSESTDKEGSYWTGRDWSTLTFKRKLGYNYMMRVRRSMSRIQEVLMENYNNPIHEGLRTAQTFQEWKFGSPTTHRTRTRRGAC